MSEVPVIKLTRKQLYEEIWKISVSGVSKKYEIPYGPLSKQIKDAGIPPPPSGYWTKVEYGIVVEKTPLAGESDEILYLHKAIPVIERNVGHNSKRRKFTVRTEVEQLQKPEAIMTYKDIGQPDTLERYGQHYNLYNREVLYNEVWQLPVIEVAKKYEVSDVALRKICKSMEIPTPPAGYWAQKHAGMSVKMIPFPIRSGINQKQGLRTGTMIKTKTAENKLIFMADDEKASVLAAASKVHLLEDIGSLHPTILKRRKEGEKLQVSKELVPRAYRIINSLVTIMEPLGCKLTDNLDFIVMGEHVPVEIYEMHDQVEHEKTKDELMQLQQYEDQMKRNSFASKPNIRKYDYPFNGRLAFSIKKYDYPKTNLNRSFYDGKSITLEDRLSDILIELFEASNDIRKVRVEKEEKQQKYEEERKKEEETENKYNTEVGLTNALINMAGDYDIACNIRALVAAGEVYAEQTGKHVQWLDWAKKKADWFDPIVAREDEYFGKREHQREAAKKILREYRLKGWDF